MSKHISQFCKKFTGTGITGSRLKVRHMALEMMRKNGNCQGIDKQEQRLVWIDCEMTGLDATQNRLVEIACIVTENDLTPVAEFGPYAIKQPPEVMEAMSDWCKETFKRNGLIERIKTEGIPEKETEHKIVEFLRQHIPPGKCPLAGNSVHQDRIFLCRYMPKLTAHLHPYRIVDVSTLKELINRWYAGTEELSKMPEKKNNHLALDDIRESIAELDFYRKQFFVAPQMPAKPSD